jgi:hypothetical protein
MTIELPYYTGLLVVAGLILVPIFAIWAYALIKLDRKKK